MFELYAMRESFLIPYLERMENATALEHEAALQRFGSEQLPSIVTRSETGNVASIRITGPLTPAGPSPLARFFGFDGTGYADIIAAAAELKTDPSIETVYADMSTPGGTVEGMDAAAQALSELAKTKKLIVRNHGQIASAGYYLAMSSQRIEAMSPLAQTGSIGVVKAGIDVTEALARNGIRRVKIVSSNAPNKQADPTTVQGAKVLQNEVDAMERVFLQRVADGRNTTTQDVIDNFGKGGMLIASDPDPTKPDALKVGMIDNVISQISPSTSEGNQAVNNIASNSDVESGVDNPEANTVEAVNIEGTVMDLSTLKAEHPAVYAAAVAEGVNQERERVQAHITMGEASGDMTLAVSCIKENAEFSSSVQAKYMAASMNKSAVNDRGDESVGDIDTSGAGSDASSEHEDQLAAETAELLGVKIDG